MIKPTYSKELFYHQITLQTRFRDLDPLNHVNNAVFSTYFEEARIKFIQTIPEFKDSLQKGHSFVLAHIEIDYVKPIFMGETIRIGSSVEEFGNSSIKGFQAIFCERNNELKAVAKTTGVWFNLAKNRPARLPDIKDPEQYLFKKG